jgi:hypothetical protein
MSASRFSACILAAVFVAACAEPPNKEIDQAQGAIDAARAVGADRYAATEYTAATDALKRAQEAVTQRDYRQALNEALDSREHAQNSAREAADTRAQLRGEVERDMAQIAALIAEANTRLSGAARTRVARRALDGARKELAAVDASVQKAGAAMRADDYLAARTALQGVKERIATAMRALEPPPSQTSRRTR